MVGAPRFELGLDGLKVRCDTASPYPVCFSFLRRALLLLRCEPAFLFFTTMANGFLGFILLLLFKKIGGNDKSRTYTEHRMKVTHYHYATLPNLVDRERIELSISACKADVIPFN